jgi:predicted transposase/invertase (TIGR01784 family)
VVSLFILDFIELPGNAYHREFRILDVDDHERFSDHLVLHTLELPKLPKVHGKAPHDEPLLTKWGRFLKAEDLEQLAMSDPIFDQAKNALEHLSADPAAQALAEERKIWAWNHENELRLAKREGREEGITEGRLHGERLVLAKLLARKFGPLPAEVRERLEAASETDLATWTDRILAAATLEEVLGRS